MSVNYEITIEPGEDAQSIFDIKYSKLDYLCPLCSCSTHSFHSQKEQRVFLCGTILEFKEEEDVIVNVHINGRKPATVPYNLRRCYFKLKKEGHLCKVPKDKLYKHAYELLLYGKRTCTTCGKVHASNEVSYSDRSSDVCDAEDVFHVIINYLYDNTGDRCNDLLPYGIEKEYQEKFRVVIREFFKELGITEVWFHGNNLCFQHITDRDGWNELNEKNKEKLLSMFRTIGYKRHEYRCELEAAISSDNS